MISPTFRRYHLNNKTSLTYITLGSGTRPVLVLPGWSAKIDELPFDQMFVAETARFLQEFRLYFLHLSNFYKSTMTDRAYTLDNYAEEIQHFLGYLSIDRVDAIGHSAGGRQILYFQHRFPDSVRRVALLSAAGLAHHPASPSMVARALDNFARERASEDELVILKQTYLNLYNSDLTDIIRHITKPTLIIWGRHDTVIPVRVAYRLQELIHDSRLLVFDHLGHDTIRYAEVFREIFTFLGENP